MFLKTKIFKPFGHIISPIGSNVQSSTTDQRYKYNLSLRLSEGQKNGTTNSNFKIPPSL